jgi:hypothetical protein
MAMSKLGRAQVADIKQDLHQLINTVSKAPPPNLPTVVQDDYSVDK